MDNKRWTILIILFLILLALWLNSTTWFRLKLADYYMREQNYDKAISICKKILRKENLTAGYQILDSVGIFKERLITFLLTNAYLKNAESHFEQAKDYFKPTTLDFHLFDRAMTEYEEINRLYEDCQKTFASIPEELSNKWQEILKKSNEEKSKACFAFGQEYIKRKMWQEARIFYTKKILKYLNPVAVLEKLDRLYNTDEYLDIKEKVWRQDIFVTLEDFEDSNDPVLIEWPIDAKPIVNAHVISKDVSHTGRRSEYLDLSYAEGGGIHDYWMKSVNLPLTNPALPLGIRVYIKSSEPFKGALRIHITYLKEGTGAFWDSDVRQEVGGGWEVKKTENLMDNVIALGSSRNWNIDEMVIDNVLINTGGISNKFYVDDIELYLTKQGID